MNKRRWFFLLTVVLAVISAACTIPGFSYFLGHTPMGQPNNSLGGEGLSSVITATPFLPMGPTATPTTTTQATSTPTPEPSLTPSLTPTPSIPEDQVNIMIFGNDYRPGLGGRTDTMILVSINTDSKVVNAISFPRDLYVEIPGRNKDRLNTAFPYGGFELFQQTMQLNFNITPDYYVMTDFTGFTNIINSLGGIDVYASYQLTDSCDLPQASNGKCTVGPGTVHMDGGTALWYVRSRYTSNDFDRNRRQQEVLMAVLRRVISWDVITNASSLYNSYRGSVRTDLPLDEFLRLVPVSIYMSQDGHLNRYAIDSSYVSNYRTETGAAVLLPNMEKINALINQVIYRQD
ncbi:MAG: LCP family protein [Anaerolineaceae bacterium]